MNGADSNHRRGNKNSNDVLPILLSFAHRLGELDRVYTIVVSGLESEWERAKLVLDAARRALEAGEATERETLDRVEASRRKAEQAEREMKRASPTLHAMMAVMLWGLLEATIEDIVVARLVAKPEYLSAKELARVRLPVAEYEQLGHEERMRYLLREAVGGDEWFESALQLVGLHGQLEPKVRRALLELGAVRNLQAHRWGVVDRKFKQRCEWLQVEVGDTFAVSEERYRDYSQGVTAYATEMIVRVQVAVDGMTREAALAEMHEFLDGWSPDGGR